MCWLYESKGYDELVLSFVHLLCLGSTTLTQKFHYHTINTNNCRWHGLPPNQSVSPVTERALAQCVTFIRALYTER